MVKFDLLHVQRKRGWLVPFVLLGVALAGCLEPEASNPTDSVPLLLITIDFDDDDSRTVIGTSTFSDASAINEVQWDWGDGTSILSNSTTSHSYARNGTYVITATSQHSTAGLLSVNQTVAVGVDPGENGGGQNDSSDDGNAGSQYTGQPFEPSGPQQPCGTLDSFEPILPTYVDPTGAVDGWPTLQLDVVMLADWAFYEAHPDDWEELLQDLVDDANLYYEEQLGLRLNVILMHHFDNGTMNAGEHDGQQRAIARGYMHANHPDLDFDFVAVILGADYEETTAGQVECVHGAVNKENAYLWSEYILPRGSTGFIIGGVFEDIPLKVFMHESAHLLAAHHHYSQCGTTMTDYSTSDATGACGLMINDVGLASYQFSQTNRLVIRSFVEELGIGEPVD